MASESITCPRCGMTSYNSRDIEEGYCGNCHWWTCPIKNPLLADIKEKEDWGTPPPGGKM